LGICALIGLLLDLPIKCKEVNKSQGKKGGSVIESNSIAEIFTNYALILDDKFTSKFLPEYVFLCEEAKKLFFISFLNNLDLVFPLTNSPKPTDV